MTAHSILHATFALERTYPVTPERVFAAWADPAAKARWFAGPTTDHELDFRVGGRETVHRPGNGDEPTLRVESIYQDIVPNKRIVYTSTLSANERLSTISLTSVQLHAHGSGTRLVLTEQGAFLDGQEEPSWREEGTSAWLNTLAREFQAPGTQH